MASDRMVLIRDDIRLDKIDDSRKGGINCYLSFMYN